MTENAEALRSACSACNLRELCLPIALTDDELESLDALVSVRRTVRRGEVLFRAGAPFDAIFAARTGFFKSSTSSDDGREQVVGFHMAGELIGLDGIGTSVHGCDAVALEDSQVCVIPFDQLESMSRRHAGLQRQFHRLMSRELARDHGVMMLLGSMRSEERLAAFLLNLLERLRARGYSATALLLRMTRDEIGSYLGLTIETVSRAFTRLQHDGVLTVDRRSVTVDDEAALRARAVRTPC